MKALRLKGRWQRERDKGCKGFSREEENKAKCGEHTQNKVG